MQVCTTGPAALAGPVARRSACRSAPIAAQRVPLAGAAVVQRGGPVAHAPLVPARTWEGGARTAVVAAAAAADAAEKSEGGLGKTLVLGGLFGAWYAFNIYFNIYNKQVLKAFPYPMTCTTMQFLVGSALAGLMWLLRLHPAPVLTRKGVMSVLPLAVVHTLGNLLTNLSLGAVAVSFTHTIKAMEPFFSVLLSAIFLKEVASPAVLATLIPIVGGVAMASASELSFSWVGFLAAMGSNVTFQSRNVLSKLLMKEKVYDSINTFSLITVFSALILFPINLALEGFNLTPAGLSTMGVADVNTVLMRAFGAAFCFHAYQQVSYLILQRVSPVTHSIGNCVKRVVVILASIVVFQNPVTRQGAIGTAIALAGVFAYSQAKRLGKKGSASKASAE